jgi:cell wall-associated NlpC family hydrolase
MDRRLLPLAAALVALGTAVPAFAGAAKPTRSWAAPQIAAVVADGMFGVTDASQFRPDDPFTSGDAAQLFAALAQTEPVTPVNPSAPVTMAGLDSRLVTALSLTSSARDFAAGARAAGLVVPSRFGTEVVARLLGLRTNHPAPQDGLELLPSDPATRAEAAFSVAKLLTLSQWQTQSVEDAASTFSLPTLTPWQRRVLNVAVSFVGYPYVWGGTSETTEAPFQIQARGGFDCSGFVWRVYKLQAYPGGAALASTIRGRSTFQMSGEVPKSERIPFEQLEPGDVLFFGAAGPKSKPAQVDHAGIYLGNGWFVHSSGYGVALAQLDGWYRDRFAWARRPLAEAGLEQPST